MPNLISHLLLALAVVMIVGRLMGRLFRRFDQPPVIGEVIGGILLGPSLLGAVWPEAYQFLLPQEFRPVLGVVAELGVVLYMFLVGVEMNPDALRGQLKSTLVIAQVGMVVPFAMGAALALYLYPLLSPPAVPFSSFALFLGVAMAVTAFPVLARILADLGIAQTPLGVRALSCAAIADVSAWCVLALVVGIVQARPEQALIVAALAGAFVAAVFVVVRPVVQGLVHRSESRGVTPGTVAVTLVALLASAWVTDAIGVHAVIGAFLAGATIPHDSKLAAALRQSFEHLVLILLLPAFFAFAGMKTEIGLVRGAGGWLLCGLIVVVATVGKFGGTFLAARATGTPARQATQLGVLMNTRGLMELIVLNIGLQLGVISPTLFTMLVIMAIVTTMATSPILKRLSAR
jgi:Kef-type K+ transport system membrane component KefB